MTVMFEDYAITAVSRDWLCGRRKKSIIKLNH
jgi:hypothetical protein